MEKLERFIIQPNLKLYGGMVIDKDSEFDVWNNETTVHQTLKNLQLITEVKKEWKYGELNCKEESKLTQELTEGMTLIWTEDGGYVIPEFKMVRLSEAINQFDILKGVEEDDATREQKNNSSSN